MQKLSRALSRLLRHRAAEAGLALDPEGWADLEEVLALLRRRPAWRDLDLERLIAATETGEKRRFEVSGGRIRARYGHSLEQRVELVAAEPPALLYHGTTPGVVERIRAEGLLPMGRQRVHLSLDAATAHTVGRRRAAAPVILVVRAGQAHAAGVLFYPGGDTVWLADEVPVRFVEFP